MMQYRKHLAATLLLLFLPLLLSACGQEPEEATPDFVYRPAFTTLGGGVADVMWLSCSAEKMYFYAFGRLPGDEAEYDWFLYSADLDGSNSASLPDYQPMEPPLPGEEWGFRFQLKALTADDSGQLWVVEQRNPYYTAPEAAEAFSGDPSPYLLRKLDENGAELLRVDLTPAVAPQGEEPSFSHMRTDSDGYLYLVVDASLVYVFDSQGRLRGEISPGNVRFSLIRLGNGKVAVSADSNGLVLKELDPEALDFGGTHRCEVVFGGSQVFDGSGQALFYLSDDNNLYRYDLAGERETVLSWVNSDVDTSLLNIIQPLADGRVICLPRSGQGGNAQLQELIILSRIPYAQDVDRKTLTLAALNLDDDVRSRVIRFNQTNADYRIEVRDYAQYNTGSDPSAGLMKLNTEIISGKAPDIIQVSSSIPLSLYAQKGLVEDLYPYIDADGELGGREALLTEALQAMEIDGHLYQAVSGFKIQTIVGRSDIVGKEKGWTYQEMQSLRQAQSDPPLLPPKLTRDGMLNYLRWLGFADYVDWQSGECRFDSEEFIALLEFVNSFPADYDRNADFDIRTPDTTLVAQGQALAMIASLQGFRSIQNILASFPTGYTYKGFPTLDGSNSGIMWLNTGLAMTTTCKDKETAWQFIRGELVNDKQREFTFLFPVNKARFQAEADNAMEELLDFQKVVTIVYPGDGTTFDLLHRSLTQADIDRFLELLSMVTQSADYDENLARIIEEECGPYFAGETTAAECAAMIQNRAEIYVNEQR